MFRNVDWDPDIENFVEFMNAAGHELSYKNQRIEVHGQTELRRKDSTVKMVADRNDAATLLCATLATSGDVHIENVPPGMEPAIELLQRMGGDITVVDSNSLRAKVGARGLTNVEDVWTGAYPGISTDWGPMLQAVMTQAKGARTLRRGLVNRFGSVDPAGASPLAEGLFDQNRLRTTKKT